jgi:GNAT superfamily N-acetyltransferase
MISRPEVDGHPLHMTTAYFHNQRELVSQYLNSIPDQGCPDMYSGTVYYVYGPKHSIKAVMIAMIRGKTSGLYLCVHPKYRDKGIEQYMIETYLSYIPHMGVRDVVLNIKKGDKSIASIAKQLKLAVEELKNVKIKNEPVVEQEIEVKRKAKKIASRSYYEQREAVQ